MRYVLGPSFSFPTPALDAASPTGKIDPTIEHLSVDGTVATFRVSAYDLATHNKLVEVRLYLVGEGDPNIPADADGYVASQFPFGHADVSGLQTGGDVPVNLPPPPAPANHAQYVLGLDA